MILDPLGWWQLRLPPSALIPFGQGVARYLDVLAAAVAFARIALSGFVYWESPLEMWVEAWSGGHKFSGGRSTLAKR